MLKAKYCVVVKEDRPSSKNFYDAINYGCIPVVFSDEAMFAFDNVMIEYYDFIVHPDESEAKSLNTILQNITTKSYNRRVDIMKNAARLLHFEVDGYPRMGEGFWSFSWMLWTKEAFCEPTKRVEGELIKLKVDY